VLFSNLLPLVENQKMKIHCVLLLLAGVCAAPPSAPAQSSNATPRASQLAAETSDTWAPTHGVKSAEEIDKEWQESVARFDGRRNALLKLADEQAHEGPFRPDWETVLANLPDELGRMIESAVEESRPDTDTIKAAIQREEQVPGAELRRGWHLRIK
jgi:hypothetical protein